MLPSLDDDVAQRVARLGKTLCLLPYPIGEDSVGEGNKNCSLHLVVAVMQMCGVALGYQIRFEDVDYPYSQQLENDNAELYNNAWVVGYVQTPVPASWLPCVDKARFMLESAAPNNVRLYHNSWIHAQAAFYHFWINNNSDRYKAAGALTEYSRHLGDHSPQITEALRNLQLIP